MKTMLLVVAALLLGRPAGAVTTFTNADNYVRSLCVYKLAQTKFFNDPNNLLTVARKFKPGYISKESQYTLTPDGIFDSLQSRSMIWSTRDFVVNRNTRGVIELDTQQAQILLISKAYEILDKSQLVRDGNQDLFDALQVCAKVNTVGPIEPDRPHSLYSQEMQNLGVKAERILSSVPDPRAETTGATTPKRSAQPQIN